MPSHHNDNWYVRIPSKTTITRETDGTLIEWTQAYAHVNANYINNVQQYYTTPHAIEFDLLITEEGAIQIYDGTRARYEKTLTETGHYKIINDLTSQKVYLDGDLLTSLNGSVVFSKYYFDFLCITDSASVKSMKYANFIIYSI